MIAIDSCITLDFPQTWERFTEGGRLVFHTPRREEIIVTVSRVGGDGATGSRSQVIEQVFANGLEAANRAALHPDLRVTKAIAEEPDICTFRCATVLAETVARDVFFGQAVILYPQGVLFVTYEAPFVDGAERMFRDALRLIHKS